MKNLKLIVGILFLVATSCKEVKEEEVKLEDNVDHSAAGPYSVAFDPQSKTYSHTIDIKINQENGKLTYNVKSDNTKDIELVSSTVTVQGCYGNQVKREILWLPVSTDLNLAKNIKIGEHVYTAKNQTGSIVHYFDNLKNCTNIKITTILKEHEIKSRVGQVCDYVDGCIVAAECKYVYSSGDINSAIVFTDRDRGYYFRNSLIDARSGLESVNTVFSADYTSNNRKIMFLDNSSGRMSFQIDKLTYEGVFNSGRGSSDEYVKCNYFK